MADPTDNVADLTLVQLRGLRRENQAIVEQQARLFEQLNRLISSVRDSREESREGFRSVRAELNEIRSDILTLEGQNMSRHGEILRTFRRLDDPAGEEEMDVLGEPFPRL